MRTGVIQPLPGIGDMIWYLPALKAIAAAAPDGQITLFTRKSAQAAVVLKAKPWLRDVVYLPEKKRGLAGVAPNFFLSWLALFRSRPDRLYILHQSIRYRLAARLAGIREIITYPAAVARSKDDGWKKSLSFLREIGIPIEEPNSHLLVQPETIADMHRRYQDYPQPWIIIAPGASTTERLWPIDRFAFCADALIEATNGTVFLIGSAREQERVSGTHCQCRFAEKIISVIGISLDQVMGLMMCSAALLGNDSGPANVAAALGRPSFPLCGTSTPPQHSPNLHFILPDLPPENGNGMERISAQHAVDAVKKIIC